MKKLIILFLATLFSCSLSEEGEVICNDENLFYSAIRDTKDQEILTEVAKGLVSPWAEEALIMLTRDYISHEDTGISLTQLEKLWKSSIKRLGYEESNRELRQQISLLSGHKPWDSPLLLEEEASDLYSYLYSLTIEKETGRDYHEPLVVYLNSYLEADDLSFLTDYLFSEQLYGQLPDYLKDWIALKELVVKKKYKEGYPIISRLEYFPQVTSQKRYYQDSYKVLSSHPDRWDLLTKWEERVDTLEPGVQWNLHFFDGLSRRSINDWNSSLNQFSLAMETSTSSYQFDRALWYWLEVKETMGLDLIPLLKEKAPLWSDPPYFDDLIDRIITSSVYVGDWHGLIDLEKTLDKWGSSDSKDRVKWILVQASRNNYYTLSPVEEKMRLQEIRGNGGDHWYTFLAELSLTGEISYYQDLPAFSLEDKPTVTESSQQGQVSRALSNREHIFSGLLERSMVEEAKEWYSLYGSQLSVPLLREYAYFLREDEQYLESIRVMGKVGRRDNYHRSQEDLRLLYPHLYSDSIEKWSAVYGLDVDLFKALVKTESGYDRKIVSYAGAIGLSQLMPATAEERMEIMGMGMQDLTDAEVNISIGTSYLDWLYNREYIENHVQATAAYNGGPGSVRSWNRAMAGYPEVLYMEGIPFLQTREYVKYLMQGAMIYGTFYGDTEPGETIKGLLPRTFID